MASTPVDLVLMDLDLGPGPDGLTATRAVIHAHAGVRVIVFTASLETEMVAMARRAGASGYLAKDLPPTELIAAVRKLATPGGSQAVFGDRIAAGSASRGKSWSAFPGLTVREQEVLSELRGGQTNRDIAARLGVSVTTVNKHVQQVFKKLHVKNRGQAVARLQAAAPLRARPGVDALN